ncbi:ABC transporter substrate-binding protein [Paenibacillus thalictri]|uniref:ABC transporter substrate-binding protein n=1 Tax=Paenibacillus thalictri TaxID=2527873 RepID=A0A4Q9DGZ3_9BACL|nr:ABC transporter substrate-binding protein [Paenibacillus thalictri]TBL71064.1 ABC transporter substrate-binding protein [Paenibacillus thalictri]
MRKALHLLLSVVFTCSLAACSSAGNSTAPSASKPADSGKAAETKPAETKPADSKPAEAPKAGGTLKVALNSEPTTLNPYIFPANNDRNVFLQVFNSLMEYDPKTLQPVPSLIKEAKASDDGLTYTLKVQEGVIFHNGKKLTANDIKYSLEKAMAPEASRTAALLKSIKEIKADNDTQLTVTLNNRDNLLLDSFIEVFVTPNDPSIDQAKSPVGTGPFKFVSWNRNEKVVLKKNDTYWKQGLPKLDGIEFMPVPDAEVKLLQLINGQVDFIDIVPTTKIEQVSNNANLQIAKMPEEAAIQDHFLLFNTTKAPFNNVKFRQAVNYALDREKMKKALFGNFVVRASAIPEKHESYNPDSPKYAKDVEKAKALLKESGYNGEKLGMVYLKLDMMYEIVAQITEQSLKDAGISIDMKGLEVAQWTDSVYQKKAFDMAITGITPKPNPVDMLNHAYGKINGGAIQWSNQAWYDNLLKVSQMSPSDGKKALFDLQKQVLDESPAIIVGGLVQLPALSKKVQGFVPNPQSKFYFEAVTKQ